MHLDSTPLPIAESMEQFAVGDRCSPIAALVCSDSSTSSGCDGLETGHASGARAAGSAPDVLPVLGLADGGSGPSTNRGLSNFARSKKQVIAKHQNSLAAIDVKYLGFDTASFSYPLTEDDLSHIEPVLLELVGQGEISHFEQRFVVSLIKFPYRYKVSIADGVELYFPSKGHAFLGVKVAAGARVCLSTEGLEREACEALSMFLCEGTDELIKSLCLSRVDVCLDVLMSETAFQHLSRLIARKSALVVTRARHREPYIEGDRYTGFSAGRGDIRLRLYDKAYKAQKDGSWEMWSRFYGEGEVYEVPEGLVLARFEWQLRRGFLRQLKDVAGREMVHTFADFKKSASLVMEYLCNYWFKFCSPARGKNHDRPMLPIWSAITAGFCSGAWSDVPVPVKRVVRRAVAGDVDKLLGMAAGCLSSAAAVLGHHTGQDGPISDAAAVAALQRFIRRDLEHWQAGRDRRYGQLAYASKNTSIYRDIWTGQPLPVPVPTAGVT